MGNPLLNGAAATMRAVCAVAVAIGAAIVLGGCADNSPDYVKPTATTATAAHGSSPASGPAAP